jgi:hypothetical protein
MYSSHVINFRTRFDTPHVPSSASRNAFKPSAVLQVTVWQVTVWQVTAWQVTVSTITHRHTTQLAHVHLAIQTNTQPESGPEKWQKCPDTKRPAAYSVIVAVTRCGTTWWRGYRTADTKMRSFGRTKYQRSTGRRTSKQEDNIKMDFKNIGSNGGVPLELVRERD